MLISWSEIQVSSSAWQPSQYFIDPAAMKDIGSKKEIEPRSPIPELLSGHPAVFQGVLACLRLKMKYRSVVLSFHRDDVNATLFNAGDQKLRNQVATAIDLFLETAFAGVPAKARPPHLISTHTHLGRVEINIALPRFVRNSEGKIRSINPHPNQKGSWNLWDALRRLLNTYFGWKDPDSPAASTSLRGPNWMEKRIAAADRNGQKFDPESDPHLYLLQYAKSIFPQLRSQATAPNYRSLPSVAKELGFEIERRDVNTLAVVGQSGKTAFSIRKPEQSSEQDVTDPATLIECFAALWKRRAIQNSKTFSKSQWPVVEPNWRLRLAQPHFEIPPAHPEFKSQQQTGSWRFRLAARMRDIAHVLARSVADQFILASLQTIPTQAFQAIRQRLELLSNDDCTPTQPTSHPYGRTLRSAPRSIEQRDGRGSLDADRSAVVRAEPDQGSDGNSCGGIGEIAATHDRGRRPARPSEMDGAETASDRHEYRLDLSNSGPGRISRGRLIRILSEAFRNRMPAQYLRFSINADGAILASAAEFQIELRTDGAVFVSVFEGQASDIEETLKSVLPLDAAYDGPMDYALGPSFDD